MKRRAVLAITVVVAGVVIGVVVAAATGGSSTTAAAPKQQLEGTWTFTVDVTGVPAGFPLDYTSLITFSRGGGLVQTAWIPPATTPAPTSAGTNPWIGHGEWVRTGNREFGLTVVIPRFDESGNFVGLAKSRASIRLDGTGRKASGRFVGDIRDADGNVVLAGLDGTVSAIRVRVEPLQ